MADSPMPVLMLPEERIGLKDASRIAGRDPRTVQALCRRHGIGHQEQANSPWVISGPGLILVLHGDFDGLEALRAGDRDHPRVARVLDHMVRIMPG